MWKCIDIFFFFFLFNLSWIKWGRGFVIITTGHVTAVVVQTGLFVHRWTFVLYKSTNCKKVYRCDSQIETQENCPVQYFNTPQYRLYTIHNWKAVCMCSCTQTPKSAIKTQEMTASPPRLSQCSDRPGSGQSFSTDRSRKTDNIYWIAGCYFPRRRGDIVPRKYLFLTWNLNET